MCRMGDRKENPDEELELDGIGGVSILVKADVHRSGNTTRNLLLQVTCLLTLPQASISPAILSKTKPRQKALPKWPSVLVIKSLVCPIMWSGTLILMKSLGTCKNNGAAVVSLFSTINGATAGVFTFILASRRSHAL